MTVSEGLKRVLWPDGDDVPSQIYTILDGARDPAIYRRLEAESVDRRCLFRGTLSPALAAAAPYLVWLTPWSAFTDWLIGEGWGRSWGIFINARGDIDRLRGHFRGMTRVKLENGRNAFFRFYDPRTLRVYLPTCNPDELDYVFGPVRSYFAESADGNALESFVRHDDRLAATRLDLAARSG